MGTHPIFESDFDCLTDMTADAVAKTAEEKVKAWGIPSSDFIDDVEKFLSEKFKSEGASDQEIGTDQAEAALRSLDELLQKYKMFQAGLSEKKRRLEGQIPEISSTLDAIKHLLENNGKTIETSFQLADAVYAKASIDCTEKVMLWLGANVMLEYDATEAQTLLTNNKENAVKSLEDVREQLAFLQDQMTTTEVSMARVYNWDVNRRKAANLK